MNNDGWGQVGAGQDDRRLAGKDLQHNMQTRTADEDTSPVRIVRQSAEGGGPMRERTEEKKAPIHEHLDHEKSRHEESRKHQEHHKSKSGGRKYDSQHGEESYKY